MTELLAVPEWNTPPRSLADWANQLTRLGHVPHVEHESSEAAWLEVGPMRLRGYAVLEGDAVTAINFELAAHEAQPAERLVTEAAQALGWEVHHDESDDDEPDDS